MRTDKRVILSILLVLIIIMVLSLFIAISKTLEHEGGWSDHALDKGGKTKYGITLSTLQSFRPGATEKDLRQMTKEDATSFYVKHFFYGMGVDRLPEGVQDIVFDMNVNHGLRNSIKILQRALVACGKHILVDGIPGPNTVTAAFSVPVQKLRTNIIEARLNFYRAIIRNNPSQQVFWRGWEKRARSFA